MPQTASEGMGTALPVILLIVGLIVIVAIAVKFIDARRKREAEAVHLQAQVSDALLRERSLSGLAITPTAHVPLWSGPVTLEVTGQAPTDETREAALAVVDQEAHRIRPDVQLIDRVTVDARRVTQAA